MLSGHHGRHDFLYIVPPQVQTPPKPTVDQASTPALLRSPNFLFALPAEVTSAKPVIDLDHMHVLWSPWLPVFSASTSDSRGAHSRPGLYPFLSTQCLPCLTITPDWHWWFPDHNTGLGAKRANQTTFTYSIQGHWLTRQWTNCCVIREMKLSRTHYFNQCGF